jgi:hypothetical protein
VPPEGTFDMLLRAEVFSALALPIGIALIVQGPVAGSPGREAIDAQTPTAVSFAEQIAPIFNVRCVDCHGEMDPESGLNLATYEGTMMGSSYGTVIVPGKPDESYMMEMIVSGDMPAEGDPMPAEEIELLWTWITEGAENN